MHIELLKRTITLNRGGRGNRGGREGVAADEAMSIYGECTQAGEFLPAKSVDYKGN